MLQDLVDIRCRADGDRFGPGQLADGHCAWVDATCYAFDDDVAVGDDAEQTAVINADQKFPDIEVPHPSFTIFEGPSEIQRMIIGRAITRLDVR